MLMTNPNESRYMELCNVIEATYQSLISDDPQSLPKIHSDSEAITRRAGGSEGRLDPSQARRLMSYESAARSLNPVLAPVQSGVY
jgi:hypothetical protein